MDGLFAAWSWYALPPQQKDQVWTRTTYPRGPFDKKHSSEQFQKKSRASTYLRLTSKDSGSCFAKVAEKNAIKTECHVINISHIFFLLGFPLLTWSCWGILIVFQVPC